ncbi:hypothetical protein KFK09_013623 [Dendrobium nobile]|uniref:Uncharacterized protein n=1 Tax=Dendrobium nobile TaxID=94219 RepID=A0A8T3B9L1_DENNO|nr:hypothetical protein KFK09_013623 [Dendrobium nobile]
MLFRKFYFSAVLRSLLIFDSPLENFIFLTNISKTTFYKRYQITKRSLSDFSTLLAGWLINVYTMVSDIDVKSYNFGHEQSDFYQRKLPSCSQCF